MSDDTVLIREYFPKGLALGEAFCNREQERATLKYNIEKGNHTLIKSPRKYGKTSLVMRVMQEFNMPFGEADLFVTNTAKRAEQQILKTVKTIISKVCSPLEQGLKVIRDYLSHISPRWTIGTQGIDVVLIPDEGNDSATNIMEALMALERLLAQKKTTAVIFIDEIQEIGKLSESKALEGAIRHVAQKTKYLVFVFSGSNRHLLTNMFEDDSRPLYKLCDKIVVERIAKEHYKKHLNKFAQKQWEKSLSEEFFHEIEKLTEWHSYYVNLLCSKLWCFDSVPTKDRMLKVWEELVQIDRVDIIKALRSLSVGQQKILIEIALGYQSKLTGKEFLQKVNMSGSSVIEGVVVLEQQDYIEQKKDKYRLIDPLIKSAINMHYANNN